MEMPTKHLYTTIAVKQFGLHPIAEKIKKQSRDKVMSF